MRPLTAASLAALLPCVAAAQLTSHQQLARDIYKEMVEVRTVHPDGDNTAIARLVAQRLQKPRSAPGDDAYQCSRDCGSM